MTHRRRGLLALACAFMACAFSLLSIPPTMAQSPATLTLSAANASVAETAGSVTVTATLDRPAPTGGMEVTLEPRSGDPGTAAIGRDYTLPEAFTIVTGDTTAEAEVIIKDDAVNERDETINLTAVLSNVLGATVVTGATVSAATITIQDNEESLMPPGSPYSGSTYVRDRMGPQNLRATPSHEALTIAFQWGSMGELRFWLQWRADDNPEWTTVTPVSSGYTISDLTNGVLYHVRVLGIVGLDTQSSWATASGTPNLQIELSAANASVAETAGSVTVTATLDQPAPTGGVEVTLAPRSGDPGTAAIGRDYTLPETFTIAAGDTTAEADVIIKDDAVNERHETINLTALNNVAGAVTDLTITIQDNEESRTPPGSGSFSGLQPKNVRAAPSHESLTITFDRAVLSVTYWLQWRADDNPEWTTVTPVTSPYTLGDLVNGVLYHVRVTGDTGHHRGGWVSASGTPSGAPAPGGL